MYQIASNVNIDINRNTIQNDGNNFGIIQVFAFGRGRGNYQIDDNVSTGDNNPMVAVAATGRGSVVDLQLAGNAGPSSVFGSPFQLLAAYRKHPERRGHVGDELGVAGRDALREGPDPHRAGRNGRLRAAAVMKNVRLLAACVSLVPSVFCLNQPVRPRGNDYLLNNSRPVSAKASPSVPS